MMKANLQAMRSMAQATMMMCDTLIAMMEEMEKPSTEAPPVTYSASTCTHPESARRPIPRMGSPRAFVCGLCGAACDPETAQASGPAPEKEG